MIARTCARALALLPTLALALSALGFAPGARAQVFAPELRTQGFAPDLQVQGGIGLGLRREIDNNFLGRVRLGGLYAYEPWIADLGVTLEIGGLAGLGLGGELELNTFGGAFGQLGLARVDDDAWMTHLALGFTIFGVEWQHRFAAARDDDALLFCVRVPLGVWWFLVRHDEDEDKRMKARATQLRAADPDDPDGEAAERAQAKAVEEKVRADDGFRAQKAIERAREESAKGNHALAAEAYALAYQLDADPVLLLLLSDAELAQGAMVSAARDLTRFLEQTRDTRDADLAAKRLTAQAKLDELSPRVPQLRIVWASEPGAEVRVEIDGQPALGAALGYDVAIDPGAHELSVRRGAAEIVRHTFRATERELVRVDVDPAAPALPAAAAAPAPSEPSEARHE